MTDITLCTNEKCTKRRKCYRATAPWGYVQSVAKFEQGKDGQCDFYIDVEKHEEEPSRLEF